VDRDRENDSAVRCLFFFASRRDDPSIAHPFMGGKRDHRNIFASRRDAPSIAHPFMGGKHDHRNIFASRRDAMLIAQPFMGGDWRIATRSRSPVRDD
jgi:hypothetical protein